MNFTYQNKRSGIGAPDKLFGVSSKAKERIAQIGRENVIDSTIGVLLADDGRLVVLDSVDKCVKALRPDDYAPYAPILGTPDYIEAVKKAVFLDQMPQKPVAACYTPGGTGAIRNAVSAYTQPGDAVLTSDWHWSPYKTISEEIGRTLTTYTLFDSENKFNAEAFEKKLAEVLDQQDQAFIIINTPAHNPTGYTFTLEDWDKVLEACKNAAPKKVVLLTDIAYMDFAGDAGENRKFLKKLEAAPSNLLPLIAFSGSKGYTMYGMRCGALICIAPDEETAKEFNDVMRIECRGSWSNGNRAAMSVIAGIVRDDSLFESVKNERDYYMEMLAKRGRAFMEAARAEGLATCPYDAGFFITIPCENAEEAGLELQKHDVFAIVIGKGIRVSVASNTEEECRIMPAKIKAAIESCR